jgi:nitronate monooxygenase
MNIPVGKRHDFRTVRMTGKAAFLSLAIRPLFLKSGNTIFEIGGKILKTKFTETFGVKYPIVGGAMMSISYPEFVAAISNAGGLGILASAIYHSKEEFAEAIDELKALTDKPFAVNLNLFPAIRPIDNNEYMEVLIEKDVRIVETSGHSAPVELSKQFKAAGMKWIHKCAGVRYALKGQELGADFVTVVGYENGGATGKLDIGTLVLVPSVVDALAIPVIGGGGVSDGRGVAAVLSLGAEAVIMGTALMLTQECPIHENLKKKLVDAKETDTMLVLRSVEATHRVYCNRAAEECVLVEKKGGGLEDVLKVATGERTRAMYADGDIELGLVACGQGVGLINAIPTVKELLDGIMGQAEEVFASRSGS